MVEVAEVVMVAEATDSPAEVTDSQAGATDSMVVEVMDTTAEATPE